MFRMFVVLTIILLISLFTTIVFDIKVGRSLPITYFLLTIMMWFCSFFERLSLFKYVLFLFIFIYFAISLSFVKKRPNSIKNFMRPSLIVFVIVFCFLYVALQKVYLTNTDDLFFWGLRLKDMQATDAMYSKTLYMQTGNSSYPPFPFLLEMSFIKLFGEFNQSYSILGASTFALSFFMPLFDNQSFKNRKDFFKVGISLFLVAIVSFCVQANKSMIDNIFIYNSLYVDWVIAIQLAYGMFILIDFDYDNYFSYINLGIILSFLVMYKQISFALALLLLATAVVCILIKSKTKIGGGLRNYFS